MNTYIFLKQQGKFRYLKYDGFVTHNANLLKAINNLVGPIDDNRYMLMYK